MPPWSGRVDAVPYQCVMMASTRHPSHQRQYVGGNSKWLPAKHDSQSSQVLRHLAISYYVPRGSELPPNVFSRDADATHFRSPVMMGNKGAGGPFAPLVVQARNIIGKKQFNKLRGKAISLHSQGALFKPPPASFSPVAQADSMLLDA